MLESKNKLDRIHSLIALHAWMTENDVTVLLIMMYASGTNSLGLEGKGLKQFKEMFLDKMCSDNKENLKELLLKIKKNLPKMNFFLKSNLR